LGVSEDPITKHGKFINKYTLPFSLLADTSHEVMLSYGVWGPKKFMGRTFDGTHRTTFIIDKSGIIRHVILRVKAATHTDDILELIS
jgi:peroxiredoxin Q/BCP